MPLTPQQRVQRARIAALARWSNEDPAENARRGQRGLLAKFEAEIRASNPDLPDAEVTRRAECARRLHMERMAFRSAMARRARKVAQGAGGEPDAA